MSLRSRQICARSWSVNAERMRFPFPRLAVEPGRRYGPSMITVYEVGTIKQVELDAGAFRTYVSVDGGMSDNPRTSLYDANYTVAVADRHSDAAPMLARVVGKHCESGDIVVRDAWLPDDIRAGDLLAVAATGAYCRSMASNYNLLAAARCRRFRRWNRSRRDSARNRSGSARSRHWCLTPSPRQS